MQSHYVKKLIRTTIERTTFEVLDVEVEVETCICASCKRAAEVEVVSCREDTTHSPPHYYANSWKDPSGWLRGWIRDGLRFYLCPACTERALAAVGIQSTQETS